MPFAHETAECVLADRCKLTGEALHTKYRDFATECPTLWSKLIDPNADLTLLGTMLRELRRVDGEESYRNASQKIGYVVYEKYAPTDT